jgi:hypothetical protein
VKRSTRGLEAAVADAEDANVMSVARQQVGDDYRAVAPLGFASELAIDFDLELLDGCSGFRRLPANGNFVRRDLLENENRSRRNVKPKLLYQEFVRCS